MAIPKEWQSSAAGLKCEMWLSLFRRCSISGFSGPELRCWPDGLSLMEQPSIVVNMFDIIIEQIELESKQQTSRSQGGKNG